MLTGRKVVLLARADHCGAERSTQISPKSYVIPIMQEGATSVKSRTQLFRVTNCGDQDVIPGSNCPGIPVWPGSHTEEAVGNTSGWLLHQGRRIWLSYPWQLLLPPLANHSCAPPPQCSLSSESTKQVGVAITGTLDPGSAGSNPYQDHSVVNTLEVKLKGTKAKKKKYSLSFVL